MKHLSESHDHFTAAAAATPLLRLYGALLRLYPRRYRELFGGEMRQLFADLLVHARSRGRLAVAAVAIRSFFDLPGSAWFAHRRRAHRPSNPKHKSGEKMDAVLQDIRYALRAFRRSPGFTTVTILTLALGIGANTAIFSVVNGVLLRPLPYENPEELALVWARATEADGSRSGVAGPDMLDLAAESELFSGFTGAWAIGTNMAEGDTPQQITLSWVGTNFFSLLGVEAALGRMFVPEDKTNTDLSVVTRADFTPPAQALVLSHGLWERSFGSDSEIVGRTIRINGQSMHVVGVAPSGFRLYLPADAIMPPNADAWTLFPVDLRRMPRGIGNLTVIGRMQPGVSVDQARGELAAIAGNLRDNFQVHSRLGTEFEIAPMHAEVVGHVSSILWVLLGAVGFVLLIACANVANLLLVRASVREREFAIRGALGSGRTRVIRLLLTEGLLLSLAGSAAGVLLAGWGVDLLLALRPENLPRVDSVGIDNTVLLFTLGASVLAAVLFGLAPAFQLRRLDVGRALSERSGSAGAPGKQRLRNTLVVTELALSLVLLMGAGLLLRSFALLGQVQPGFNSDNVMTANISLPFFSYRDWDKRTRLFQQLSRKIAAMPGVESVGGISPLPLSGGDGQSWTGSYALNEEDRDDWVANEADYRPVLPGYFTTMETPLLSGRTFTEADNRTDARLVAIVDEKFVAKVWPDENAIGQQLMVQVANETSTGSRAAMAEVVGVVAHVRHTDLTRDGRETIYMPYHAYGWFEVSLVVKTAVEPSTIAAGIRAAVNEIDPELPVFAVRTMDDYVADAMAPVRFALVLIAVFASVAVLLAAIGLYGLISYLVRQRTREIGLRLAFGAETGTILRLVIGQGLVLAGTGIAIGVAAAFAVTRVMANFLFGVTATDPLTFIVIPAVLLAVAILASYIPARRAMSVDPMEALRAE